MGASTRLHRGWVITSSRLEAMEYSMHVGKLKPDGKEVERWFHGIDLHKSQEDAMTAGRGEIDTVLNVS